MNVLQIFGDNYVYLCFFLTVAGVVASSLNQCSVQQVGFKAYWSINPGYSVVAIVGALITFVQLTGNQDTSLLAYFSVGFAADSLLNKVTAPSEILKQERGN